MDNFGPKFTLVNKFSPITQEITPIIDHQNKFMVFSHETSHVFLSRWPTRARAIGEKTRVVTLQIDVKNAQRTSKMHRHYEENPLHCFQTSVWK